MLLVQQVSCVFIPFFQKNETNLLWLTGKLNIVCVLLMSVCGYGTFSSCVSYHTVLIRGSRDFFLFVTVNRTTQERDSQYSFTVRYDRTSITKQRYGFWLQLVVLACLNIKMAQMIKTASD